MVGCPPICVRPTRSWPLWFAAGRDDRAAGGGDRGASSGDCRVEAAVGAELAELVEAAVVGLAVHQAGAEVVAPQERPQAGRAERSSRDRRWRWSPNRTRCCGTSPARAPAAARTGGPPWSGWSAAGVRPAPDEGAGHRAPAGRAPLRLRSHHLRRRAGGGDGAGAVRAADHRDHPLSVCRAVPVQEAHRAGAGRAVRHPGLGGHGRGHVRPRRRRAGRFLADRRRMAGAEVAGFDETGLRVAANCTGCTAPAPATTP